MSSPEQSATAVPLEQVLITAELAQRPSREPDFAAENRALVALAEVMASHPEGVLRLLLETVLDLCRAESAGVSVIEHTAEGARVLWKAVAGRLASLEGLYMPSGVRPTEELLDHDQVQLLDHPARHFTALGDVDPPILESLLIPFRVRGQPGGIVWAAVHLADRGFDAEDARLLESLSRFASVADQMSTALQAADETCRELQRQVVVQTQELSAAKVALRLEANERQRAEGVLRETQEELVAELSAINRLHSLSTRLFASSDLHSALEEILDAAIALHDADMGSVRLYDAERETLAVVARRGDQHDQPGNAEAEKLTEASSAALRRLMAGESIVSDGNSDPAHDPEQLAMSAGYRNVQSTPLRGSDGKLLGILSTHFRASLQPSQRDLRMLDLYARQAGDLIERIRAQQKIRESEALHRAIARNLPRGAAFVVDRDLRYCLADGQTLRDLGLTSKDLEGKHIRDVFPPDRAEHYEKYYRGALEGQPFELEHADRGRHYLTRGAPLYNEQAEVYAALAVSNDITDRKESERSLQASEQRFRALVEEVKDYVIYMIDPQGTILTWNEGAARIKGYRADEVIGKNFSIFHTPEARAAGKPERELKTAAERGRYEIEDWRVRKDGSRFWGSEVANPIRDSEGNLLGFTKIIRDLTERKRAEDALRASEQRYRLMVNEVKDYAIFMVDTASQIVTWNAGAEIILGYSESEAIGQPAELVFTPEDRERRESDKELVTARLTGRAQDERWHLRKDGTRFWGSGVMTALWNPDGSLHGYVKLMRDLTNSKLLEEERAAVLKAEQTARHEAEAVNKMKDEFLANLSHELRTPISAVIGWARLLRMPSLSELDRAKGVEIIERNSNIQARMIEDLLDTSRIISGNLQLLEEAIDLRAVTEAAIETVKGAADLKDVTISLSARPNLGLVVGDPQRLQQVVWNLVANAVKFTPAGGRVDVRLTGNDCITRIQVTDTGRGIARDFLPHVFDRFRQADASTSRQQGGLGLGLAIVRQLVELHGGTIYAESAGPEKGATFTVELPVGNAAQRRAVRSNGDEHEPDSPEMRSPASLVGLKVLLVEDQPDMREYVESLLTICGCQVVSAASAQEGLAQIQEEKPDVILTDIAMPTEDGFYLLRHVREREVGGDRTTPVIALTAFAGEEDRQRILAAGFTAHLAKPIDPPTLLKLLDAVIDREEGMAT